MICDFDLNQKLSDHSQHCRQRRRQCDRVLLFLGPYVLIYLFM